VSLNSDEQASEAEAEKCPYCGIIAVGVCTTAQPDLCERAIDQAQMDQAINDMLNPPDFN
jgi:hypothetical protein